MKKPLVFLMTLIILSLTLFGCGSKDNNDNSQDNNSNTVTQTSDIKQLSNVVGFSKESYDVENDYQPFVNNTHDIAYCNEGYYFFEREYLYFFDKASKKAVPVCNKPDCEHEDDSCNAHFSVDQFYVASGVFYHDSHIYILGTDGEQFSTKLYLYKISKDGTSREKTCYLGNYGSNVSTYSLEFIIHKNNGYLLFSDDNMSQLKTFNINDDKPKLKEIDKIKGTGANLYRLTGFGDVVAYQYGCFSDESMEHFEGGIKLIINGKPQTVVEGAIKTYFITDGKIYYETDSGLDVLNIKDKSTKTFNTPDGANSVTYDGKYFYLYNDGYDDYQFKIYVYDSNEKLIDTVTTPKECTGLLFGSDDFFFADFVDGKKGIMKYFEKSQLGTGKINWKTACEKYYESE
ncbi:MAG: hypothetical protein IJV39_00730 [Ruminococcus sp.]|nr:hypothetical protein [Ruminococcus sp.]